MKRLLVLATVVTVALASDLPPSCHKPVYCDSDLLHHVQMNRLYPDSKTFVDLHLRNDENTTLAAFQSLLEETSDNPSKEQLQQFVDEYFNSVGELDDWTPSDFSNTTDPKFLLNIRDETLRQFGRDIYNIWPILGRKVKDDVLVNSHLYSLIPVTNGFIIPGGRFKEVYYWDAYWIVEGLLISEMQDTVRGMLENFFQLLKQVGHIPNGGRWYYQERSQPPLLTAMMNLYIKVTKDYDFLRAHIKDLEQEIHYWLDKQTITVNKGNTAYTLLRYNSPSRGPRPESYYEDYTHAEYFETAERQQQFYNDIKSGAESGWDFSSRWYVDENGGNSGNLTNIHTQNIIPVDLNAIFANAVQDMADFYALLRDTRKSVQWAILATKWRRSIENVLWHEDDGVWYDYDVVNEQHRRYFFPSNVAPLWLHAVEQPLVERHAPRVIQYLRDSQGLDFPGGVPASLDETGEQWDLPNAWPPLVSIVINALENLGTVESKDMAFNVAQTWVRANLKGFTETNQMFEKYDVNQPGKVGGGGEYTVQTGFGWSNGVVLEIFSNYGSRLTANDSGKLKNVSTSAKTQKEKR